MSEELDYAEMLEIPVNTVNVVKKKSIFKHKAQKAQPAQEDLKEKVVESVNERAGAYVYAEDLSDPPAPELVKSKKRDKAGKILIGETIAIGALALAIFLTNVFMPNSVINAFIGSFSKTSVKEPAYTEFTLAPVVNTAAENEVKITDNGVLCFTSKGSVYPICKGTVSKVYESEGVYTLEIAHTSTFKSVFTGLSDVYSKEGTAVVANIPVGYSDGSREVRVSMYDNDELLNCYTLSGEVPVWKS